MAEKCCQCQVREIYGISRLAKESYPIYFNLIISYNSCFHRYNFYTFGHAVRNIEASRGSKEGNNAFLKV